MKLPPLSRRLSLASPTSRKDLHTRDAASIETHEQMPYNSWVYGPATITPAPLRLDPLWDPLRFDPAFQRLCEEKQK